MSFTDYGPIQKKIDSYEIPIQIQLNMTNLFSIIEDNLYDCGGRNGEQNVK